jgi:tetratricopeptide (TPR) repeat protein
MRGGILAAVILLATAAFAQEPDEEIARRHFERGRLQYAAGNYAAALQEFLAARKVHPVGALDYNIARCYDRLEKPSEAITNYQQYLLSEDNPPDAAQVRQRVEILKQRLEMLRQHRPLPPEAEGGASLRIAGITVGAIGLACLVAGLATGVLAQQASDDLSKLDQTRPRVPFDPAKESEGKTDQLLEGVFLGVGFAAVATAAVLYGVGHRAKRPKALSLREGLCVHF